jgi:hypothetical protein
MDMTKVSVSTLEAFRLFQAEVLEEKDLLERLVTPFQPDSDNVRIQRGNDLHRYIEDGHPGRMKLQWDLATVDAALEPADREGEAEVWISDKFGGIWIPARVDNLNGMELRDFKVTSAGFDVDKYAASCQWRFYLLLTGCLKFTYRVFEVSDSVPIKVFRHHSLPLYPYPAMHDDCAALLGDFLTWARFNAPAIEAAETGYREAVEKAADTAAMKLSPEGFALMAAAPGGNG